MSKIDDERTKLTATFFNGVAIAMIVAGVIAPLAAFTYGLPGSAGGPRLALAVIGWAIAGVVAHNRARHHLRKLTP